MADAKKLQHAKMFVKISSKNINGIACECGFKILLTSARCLKKNLVLAPVNV